MGLYKKSILHSLLAMHKPSQTNTDIMNHCKIVIEK